MIEAASKGELNFLYSIGGNLLETMPDRKFIARALEKVAVRVHQDIVLNSSMLLDAEQAVLILPGQTRYEQRGGGTTTNTERRIRFTPEIPGHQIGHSLPEWEIPAIIGRHAMPNGDLLFPYEDPQSIRDEMSRVMPIYQGIEKLTGEGDHLQWGGPYLHKAGHFSNMPNGRAHFSCSKPARPSGIRRKVLSRHTSRQAVQQHDLRAADRLMGAKSRDIIFISPEDAQELELGDGARVVVRSDTGEMNAVIQIAPVKSGTLQLTGQRPMSS